MERLNERVLLVDDDPRNVRLLEGIFHAGGYRVTKAYGGDEALRLVAEEAPDLILLDVMMPRMSGHEVCSRLKSDPATRAIPVIMVTALNAVEDKVQGLDIGADDFVSKPVNRIELLAKARSLLRSKALNDELRLAKAELEAKNEELRRLEELKNSLTQMIVHDLKNPLTAIMGNLDLMLSQGPTGRTDERLSRTLESSRSMMRLILDLLDVGRLEEDRLPLKWERFEPAALLGEQAAEVEGLARLSGIGLAVEAGDGLGTVLADRMVLGRIVSNLLSNAIKHTPAGGTVTLTARREPDGLLIAVADTGEGIPEEFQKMIFEKFGQPPIKKRGLATDRGLGLAFCRLATEAHGGTISVESLPGSGSVFSVRLPDAADPADRPEPVSGAAAPAPER